jgi:CTP:molybdopterin cytidylyltransferase MocA
MTNVVGMLLAAGGGMRFDGPTHKLLAPLPATGQRPAETVVERSLASLVEADIGPIVVVTGAADLPELGWCLAPTEPGSPAGREIAFVHNSRWADGQATSVQVGIAAARQLGADRVVIGLGDQPGVSPDAWRSVADAGSSATIAVASYDGRRGNPVAVGSDIWSLLPRTGDVGARSVMRIRPELVVEVPCSGSSDDIDTTEDLRRWQNNSSTNSP